MSGRHRALPSWMAKKEEKVKEKEPLRSRRRRKTARAAFYCMNERELVEAAVSYLTNAACDDAALPADRKVADRAVDPSVKMKEIPSKTTVKPVTEAFEEASSDCGDARETTCVSETDVDMTEVEKVPGPRSLQPLGPGGQRSEPVQDHGGVMNVGLEAEKKQAHAAEEDDALRLVREIFFT
ncbi:uncharacterized protein LOC143322322 [Chaetodon auriga]|uniref:uncharacterized protein LOC143322322 n=1 Tax=Chaetodon auriga TaxID=39042 RepID=UPI004032F940